jgi:hypothetical protein
MTLWLKSQDTSSDFTGSSLRICWGSAPTPTDQDTTPAIEIVLFNETSAGNPATAQIIRYALDSNAGARGNGFALPDNFGGACSIGGQSFQFEKTISLSGLHSQFAVIRMFYNTDTAQPIAFDSTDAHTFPTQGLAIDSSGTAGQSTRRVSVFQSWPGIPDPFQTAIYSSTGITK